MTLSRRVARCYCCAIRRGSATRRSRAVRTRSRLPRVWYASRRRSRRSHSCSLWEDRKALLGLLTAEECSWITEADPELIVPLSSSRGETVALFVLGPKRSGLLYTRDEEQAVTAFTAATALALENVVGLGDRTWGLDAAEEPAGECHRCGYVALRAEGLCACRRPLAPAAIPYEFAGKFRLNRVLGEGGMGVVYRATDLALDRQVALKTLPRLGSEALLRLRREARSMAGFLHPNLALIFGAETWRGVPILVVEYLAGGSLASRLGEPMAPREVLCLGMDLAGALEAMHDKGLLHRDVKPSNIGFTGGGVPKLLDFGLARLHEEAHFEMPVLEGLSAIADEKLRLTLTGQVVGTPLTWRLRRSRAPCHPRRMISGVSTSSSGKPSREGTPSPGCP